MGCHEGFSIGNLGTTFVEVVPDSSLLAGGAKGLSEEARSVAALLVAWREVGESGVVSGASICQNKVINDKGQLMLLLLIGCWLLNRW